MNSAPEKPSIESLNLHILNVGNGDSILVEFPDGSWGVIDSNLPDPFVQPLALTFLQERNVSKLAFVCLTHPHADHYSGLSQILDYYGDDVEEVWMFRLDSAHLKKLIELQQRTVTTDSRRRSFDQLVEFFRHMSKKLKRRQVRYLEANMTFPGVCGVDIDCLAPHSTEVNKYTQQVERSLRKSNEYYADENLLSAVLRLRYGSASVLLSSDTPTSSWISIWKESQKRGEVFAPSVIKVSHHGSKSGFHSEVWRNMSRPLYTHGAISAGAEYGHPDAKVISTLYEMGVRLHCTNYPTHCLKGARPDFSKFHGLPERLKINLIMLDQTSNLPVTPCNGNLHFQITSDANVTTHHQYDRFCPFHVLGSPSRNSVVKNEPASSH